MGVIAQIDGGALVQIGADQVLPDDDDDHAGGADVLLDAAIDQAIVADVAGLGQEHGGLVGNQDLTFGIGQVPIGGAMDGLIFADVHIVCIRADRQVGHIGNVAVIPVLAGGQEVHLANFLASV